MESLALQEESLYFATGFFERLKGLLFTKPDGRTLLLAPCKSIHTFGMSHALDIAFIDKTGRVLKTHRNVGPLQHLKQRTAVAVLERFSCIDRPWFEEGSDIVLRSSVYIKVIDSERSNDPKEEQ